MLSKQDVIRGLGWINPGITTQWPQTSETLIENAEPSAAVTQVTRGISPFSGIPQIFQLNYNQGAS